MYEFSQVLLNIMFICHCYIPYLLHISSPAKIRSVRISAETGMDKTAFHSLLNVIDL